MKKHLLSGAITILMVSFSLFAQSPATGKNYVMIRGRQQEIYYYPASGRRLNREILFAPGDGGWQGFAIVIARTMSSWGYDVYGLDTKRYLESFTGKTSLKESDVMGDFQQIARWIVQGSNQQVALVGWSEGAGLELLAAARPENKTTFSGLITLGLGKSNVLGWRWVDDFTYITKKDPDEPMFESLGYMPQIAPLPLLMIQSTRDEYVPELEARQLFEAAKQPKRFASIQAQDHRFGGNRDRFFLSLREGLEWMSSPHAGERP